MRKYFICLILLSAVFLAGCNGKKSDTRPAFSLEYGRLTYLRTPNSTDTYYEWISDTSTGERTNLDTLAARLGVKDESLKHSYDIVRYLLLEGWELVGVTDSNPSRIDNAIYPTKETYHFVRRLSK